MPGPAGDMTADRENNSNEQSNSPGGRSREEKIRFYLSAASLALLFSSFTVFVFLIPFIIDPAVASLRGELSPSPVTCRVVSAQYRLGVSRCGWSSCREGCTQDIYQCHQVLVEYSPLEYPDLTLPATLLVNIRGCGYPPQVNCSTWFINFGVNDSSVPCYYSRTNTSLALTQADTERDRLDLILSIAIPSLLFTISIIIICILHAECCRKFSNHKQSNGTKVVSGQTQVPKNNTQRSGNSGEGLPKKRRKIHEKLEDYGRTSSRDKLISEPKKSWRRNSVKKTLT